jgi:hypothetical protein
MVERHVLPRMSKSSMRTGQRNPTIPTDLKRKISSVMKLRNKVNMHVSPGSYI